MKKQILKKLASAAAALTILCTAAAGGVLDTPQAQMQAAAAPPPAQTETVQPSAPQEPEKEPVPVEEALPEPPQESAQKAEPMPSQKPVAQPEPPQPAPVEPELAPEKTPEPVLFLQETPELAAQDPMAPSAEENSPRHPELADQLPENELLLTPEQIREALDSGALVQAQEQCIDFEDENCLIRWLWEWLFGKKEEKYSGWRTENGKTYYYAQDTNKKLTGIQSVDGKLYYFDADGVMQEGVTFGIDVSKYQTGLDWKKIKNSGVSFVIIRIGYRGYGAEGKLVLDPMFEEHFTNARNAGLKVGVYFFSQAVNEDEAREEAFGCAYVLNGRALDYPIYFDTEASTSPTGTGRADALGVTERTDCAVAFCEEVKLHGYRPGVYASTLWFRNRVEYDRLSCYSIWNAHYGVPSSPVSCDLWQGSCSVTLNGYAGQLDANISYVG